MGCALLPGSDVFISEGARLNISTSFQCWWTLHNKHNKPPSVNLTSFAVGYHYGAVTDPRLLVAPRVLLRWPEPTYMRVGYVFDLRFLEWKIQPISMIFGIPNK